MPGYTSINSKMLQVPIGPGQEVYSRRGAMLAYTGHVNFAPTATAGQGIGRTLGRAVAGERTEMMHVTGQGSVMFGKGGLHVEVVHLAGDTLYVEADRLLVHDATLQVGTMFMGEQGGIGGVVRGAVSGQGLFTTTLTGQGACALLSHGGVMEMPISPQRPVHVDPQAYVAHRGQVQNKLTTAMGLRDLVGRGSGEGFQLELSGSGVVYVQASERKI
ncbi:AIM24 family protein [Actinomadura barringtoniae]|uniref:AIM24 family protein n=1 Tax=Actinomadura barringtoniae TaxID=1427535 RepID=A0A939PCB0_9ACTN|nr:AIM24 family protein [Actinomadura barringtoniae]MBO2449975.1 AIM24 family protein [Actinomadura barringtoniae]